MVATACCGILEKLYETYELPFYRPMVLDEKHDFVTGDWTARLFTITPSGDISEKSTSCIKLTFCPFCGVRLVPEGNNDSEE